MLKIYNKGYGRFLSMAMFVLVSNMSHGQCTLSAQEMVINGSFEECNGACGTTTQALPGKPKPHSPNYGWQVCNNGAIIASGKYSITSNPSKCYNEFISTDVNKTPNGKYAALFDGTTNANSILWSQTVAIAPGETYQYSAWYKNPWLKGTGGSYAVPKLFLSINGTIVGTSANVSLYQPWANHVCTWTAKPGETSAIIAINLASNGNKNGNDVLIDDISFRKVVSSTSCQVDSCLYTLPVNLSYFKAEKMQGSVLVDWMTTQEKSTSYFEIESSEDGNEFSVIAKVKAKGNSDKSEQYSYYNPLNPAYPFYRLKITDADGDHAYSSIAYVPSDESVPGVSSCIRAGEPLSVRFHEETEGSLAVTDMKGSTVFSSELQLKQGDNQCSIPAVKPGSYIIRISTRESQLVQKLIVLQD